MYFNSKMAYSNYSDIRSLCHSNYSNPKFHIRFSPSRYTIAQGFDVTHAKCYIVVYT